MATVASQDFAVVREYGCTIQDRPSSWYKWENEQSLMRRHTRTLHIRLRGHWWDDQVKDFFDETEASSESEWPDVIPPAKDQVDARQYEQLRGWRSATNEKLGALFDDLCNFANLEDVLIQTSCEPGAMIEGSCAYINASTVEKLLACVPKIASLESLTMDLSAGYLCDTSLTQAHGGLCGALAAVLPYVPKIRLRVHPVCADIFESGHELDVQRTKLRSLVLKQHVPYLDGVSVPADPSCCRGHSLQAPEHRDEMIRGTQALLATLGASRSDANRAGQASGDSNGATGNDADTESSSLELLRISYPMPSPAVEIEVFDALRNQRLVPGESFFVYEDDGMDCWDLEERTDLIDV